jgi:hypothetical protein
MHLRLNQTFTIGIFLIFWGNGFATKVEISNTPEIVLSENTILNVSTTTGNLSIIAGVGFARQYRWDGCIVDANMAARVSRWQGDFGIYDPVGGKRAQFKFMNPSCSEKIHMPVSEGQMHFADVQIAEEWLRRKTKDTVWTNNGIVVTSVASKGKSLGISMRGLGVNVTMICINGSHPERLAGASDEKIELISHRSQHPTIRECRKPETHVIDDTRRHLEEQWSRSDGHQRIKK